MKPIAATLLATALTVALSSAYAFDAKPNMAAYHAMTQQATADYKMAAAKCAGMAGHERDVCTEQAKVTRAQADLAAVTQHNNTVKARAAARVALANAEFALSNAKCSAMNGSEKEGCTAAANTVRMAALADAKADRAEGVAAAEGQAMPARSPEPSSVVPAAPPTLADRAAMASDTAVQKTKDAAAVVAEKTERVGERMADTTEHAASSTGKVVADSVITTKVKADLFKEPELSSMAIHVETEKGVVMLSGFVDSKAAADKAVTLAKSVEGVNQVKSAIKVK